MTRGDGYMRHLDPDGAAVPRSHADAMRRRLLDFRALEVIFDVGQRLPVEIRLAKDPAIHRDERDARRHQLRQAIGFVIEVLLGGDRGIAGEELGDELCLADQAHFDGPAFVLALLVGDEEREEGERCGPHAKRYEEDLRAKAEGHVLTLPLSSLSASL